MNTTVEKKTLIIDVGVEEQPYVSIVELFQKLNQT